ncbi:MAG: hypothetical protein SVT56_03795 [Chloroflexota bacterium]|nr:hypothetical protein [Chloroflexota bacterium]
MPGSVLHVLPGLLADIFWLGVHNEPFPAVYSFDLILPGALYIVSG